MFIIINDNQKNLQLINHDPYNKKKKKYKNTIKQKKYKNTIKKKNNNKNLVKNFKDFYNISLVNIYIKI